MTTRYQCQGCKLVFEGFDPVHFGDNPEAVFPVCPNNLLVAPDPSKGLEAAASLFDDLERDHPVGLAVIVQAQPVVAVAQPSLGKWGKPLEVKKETEEEQRERERQRLLNEEQQRREKADREAASRARSLVQRMDLAMDQRSGCTTSSRFPMDLEYGIKKSGSQSSANADVIQRASALWLAKGADYAFRAPAYKPDWGQTMANFERLIVSGNAAKGKHNYHVVLE